MQMRVFMVHYKDREGVTQRVRVAAADEAGAKRRVELRERNGCVEKIHLATSAEKIRPQGAE